MSSFGTFPGGWVESIIKLISAEGEAFLGLAELGNNVFQSSTYWVSEGFSGYFVILLHNLDMLNMSRLTVRR